MYKLVIADDDEILLKGLSTVVDWNALNIDVAASVDDGDKALEAVRELNADILLTDIKMTNMDGLELIAKMNEEGLYPTVVVMSAYDDFQYAREALRMSVKDYLVKPINLQMLEDVMKQVVMARTEEISQNEEIVKLVIANKDNLEEEFYKSTIRNEYTREECLVQAEQFLKVEGKVWRLIEVLIDEHKEKRQIREKIRDLCKKNHLRWIGLNQNENLICFCGEKEEIENQIKQFKLETRELTAAFEPELRITFLNGAPAEYIYELSISYESIGRIKEFLYIERTSTDLYEEDIERYYNHHHTLNKSVIESLAQIVLYGKESIIHEYVKKFEYNLRSAGNNSKIMFSFALSIFLVELNSKANEKGINIENIQQEYNRYYKEMVAIERLDAATACFEKLLQKITKEIHDNSSISNVGMVKKAVVYIDNNFTNPEFRISDAAKYIGLSQNYFSTIFKEETGQSFTDYLIEKRMEKAQQLIINTDYRSSDIATMVGYDNPTYFSTLFKKYTGITVSKYREGVKS